MQGIICQWPSKSELKKKKKISVPDLSSKLIHARLVGTWSLLTPKIILPLHFTDFSPWVLKWIIPVGASQSNLTTYNQINTCFQYFRVQSPVLNISWSGTSCHEPHPPLPFPSHGVQAASTQIEDALQDLSTQVCTCSHSCHHLKVKPAAWWPAVPQKTQESIVTKTANLKCQA